MDKISWWWNVMVLPWLAENKDPITAQLLLLFSLITAGCMGYLAAAAKDLLSDYNVLENPEKFSKDKKEEAKQLGVFSVRKLVYIFVPVAVIYIMLRISVSVGVFALFFSIVLLVMAICLTVSMRKLLRIVVKKYKEKSETFEETETPQTSYEPDCSELLEEKEE